MSTTIPTIEVGILFSPAICFRLNGQFQVPGQASLYSGSFSIGKEERKYLLSQNGITQEVELPLTFTPSVYERSDFDLTDVVIGINFHWERTEDQKFKGTLKIIDEGDHLTAVNILPLEDYLLSVISSEMNATSSLELLKAHAVISRSWLLAQKAKSSEVQGNYSSRFSSDEEIIRWYDREDHAHFDVCADDHCQRYQGISRAYTSSVSKAVTDTRGEVLTYEGKICDARFSKCCGGVSERFEHTWEPVVHPYLDKVEDAPTPLSPGDLSQEENARKWILSAPAAFCNTTDKTILSNVLNNYDQETQHFFRWQVEYTAPELTSLVKKRTGLDFGLITSITPIERGVSGRIVRLRVTGSKLTKIIGKELFIRKAFSESHLYSSAFIVEQQSGRFVLHGAGWGHGVGLCQIGAAVMGAKGYSYREILQHYFRNSQIQKIY